MKQNALLLILLALAWPAGARAAASCTILPAPGGTLVDFGTYNALGGNLDAIGHISFLCVPDLLTGPTASYALSVSAGTGSGGSFNPRRLTGSGFGLNYNMFLDPARTQLLGDGSSGTSKSAGTCAGTCAIMVYGRIFGGQFVPAAPYQDDILVTLEF